MANSRKISKISLNINNQEYPVFMGIVCPDPDYKLSLKLNRKLGISLKNSEPIVIPGNKGNLISFSRFSFTAESQDITFLLLCNRSGREFLLKKLKNIDFILVLNAPHGSLDTDLILKTLRETDSVTGVFSIEAESVKDKNLKYLF